MQSPHAAGQVSAAQCCLQQAAHRLRYCLVLEIYSIFTYLLCRLMIEVKQIFNINFDQLFCQLVNHFVHKTSRDRSSKVKFEVLVLSQQKSNSLKVLN